MDTMESMLKELTETHGVSGSEGEISRLMEGHLSGIAELSRDRLGSFVARVGGADRPRVMLAAHMDEIGLSVSHFTGRYVRFNTIGGWWAPNLIGMQVEILTARGPIPGVVASKSPFHMDRKELDGPFKAKDLYIDIGLAGKRKPESLGIRPGDPAVPVSSFTVLKGGKTYMAKAWDDRAGCAVLVESMRRLARSKLPCAVYAVGTVQEEVGIRGAQTAARMVDPDVCLAIDVNVAQDLPGSPEGATEELGAGVSICVYDATLLPNTRLRDIVVSVAKRKKIPYHFSAIPFGGTDGGKVHLTGFGVPTLVIGIPTRHIHSGAGILHRGDLDAAISAVVETVKLLDAKTVAGLV